MSHEPLCPYCSHRLRDMSEYGMGDYDVVETECPSCDKPISIRCTIEIDYDIIKRGNPGCQNTRGFNHDCCSGEPEVVEDCSGDGHYMCEFCTRFKESDDTQTNT